jgi:hypothetical protein
MDGKIKLNEVEAGMIPAENRVDHSIISEGYL